MSLRALIPLFAFAALLGQLMAMRDTPDLKLVGIDWRDTRDAANRWLVRHGNPYDTVVFDPHSKLIVPLGVTGAPESFIVDKAGQIRYKLATGIMSC